MVKAIGGNPLQQGSRDKSQSGVRRMGLYEALKVEVNQCYVDQICTIGQTDRKCVNRLIDRECKCCLFTIPCAGRVLIPRAGWSKNRWALQGGITCRRNGDGMNDQ